MRRAALVVLGCAGALVWSSPAYGEAADYKVAVSADYEWAADGFAFDPNGLTNQFRADISVTVTMRCGIKQLDLPRPSTAGTSCFEALDTFRSQLGSDQVSALTGSLGTPGKDIELVSDSSDQAVFRLKVDQAVCKKDGGSFSANYEISLVDVQTYSNFSRGAHTLKANCSGQRFAVTARDAAKYAKNEARGGNIWRGRYKCTASDKARSRWTCRQDSFVRSVRVHVCRTYRLRFTQYKPFGTQVGPPEYSVGATNYKRQRKRCF